MMQRSNRAPDEWNAARGERGLLAEFKPGAERKQEQLDESTDSRAAARSTVHVVSSDSSSARREPVGPVERAFASVHIVKANICAGGEWLVPPKGDVKECSCVLTTRVRAGAEMGVLIARRATSARPKATRAVSDAQTGSCRSARPSPLRSSTVADEASASSSLNPSTLAGILAIPPREALVHAPSLRFGSHRRDSNRQSDAIRQSRLEPATNSPSTTSCTAFLSEQSSAFEVSRNYCDNSLAKDSIPKFSIKNGFAIGTLPTHLADASLPERLITQPVSVVAVTRVMRGGAYRFIRSHCLAFDFAPAPAATLLPIQPDCISTYRVVLAGPFTTEHSHVIVDGIADNVIFEDADAEVCEMDAEHDRVGGVSDNNSDAVDADVVERRVVFMTAKLQRSTCAPSLTRRLNRVS
ncbi:hypothetical protein PF010_g23147 [Phytophthora fragariae]|uniref:DUF6570 domain-containing protein n=1 Tax=Phytophthora fragariae TaxID=53985 RepID=A0A6G0K799_9STRA|nr:hypothetical protein PF010_g23147 [Phytophthora fragariae]